MHLNQSKSTSFEDVMFSIWFTLPCPTPSQVKPVEGLHQDVMETIADACQIMAPRRLYMQLIFLKLTMFLCSTRGDHNPPVDPKNQMILKLKFETRFSISKAPNHHYQI